MAKMLREQRINLSRRNAKVKLEQVRTAQETERRQNRVIEQERLSEIRVRETSGREQAREARQEKVAQQRLADKVNLQQITSGQRAAATAERRQYQEGRQRSTQRKIAVLGATGYVANQAKPGINLFLLIMFVVAGLIIFYNLVTGADLLSGTLGKFSNSLSLISTNAPLFTKTPTQG